MSEFTEAVEQQLVGVESITVGIDCGCSECGDFDCPEDYCDADHLDEGSFSWNPCDSCGSALGGNRYAVHGWLPEIKSVIHLDVCEDCLCYLANGDEPQNWS